MPESNETPTVTVTVPGLLGTLRGCVDRLVEAHPPLDTHFFDGSGRLRPHVELFHNGNGIEWDDVDSVELDDRDEVLVPQAVSGG